MEEMGSRGDTTGWDGWRYMGQWGAAGGKVVKPFPVLLLLHTARGTPRALASGGRALVRLV